MALLQMSDHRGIYFHFPVNVGESAGILLIELE